MLDEVVGDDEILRAVATVVSRSPLSMMSVSTRGSPASSGYCRRSSETVIRSTYLTRAARHAQWLVERANLDAVAAEVGCRDRLTCPMERVRRPAGLEHRGSRVAAVPPEEGRNAVLQSSNGPVDAHGRIIGYRPTATACADAAGTPARNEPRRNSSDCNEDRCRESVPSDPGDASRRAPVVLPALLSGPTLA